ncbi:MAG: hypothetical protein AAF978_05440, partial [Cyanobacteria bacterium P01_E01_bin.48]
YHAMIDSGLRQEHHVGLVAGNIVEMPSEGLLHASQARRGRTVFEREIRRSRCHSRGLSHYSAPRQ